MLAKEFESVGFYITNHPLQDYQDALQLYKVKSFKEFESTEERECYLAGTVMQIKERKTAKGTSFAIVKFSDLSKVFELFLFSEILERNRSILLEGKSFIITVIKDKDNEENRFKRINVRKILSLSEVTNKKYNDVHIELNTPDSLSKLYESIKEKGDAKIKIMINNDDKKYFFELKEKRKFDYEMLKNLNKEQYIKKISV